MATFNVGDLDLTNPEVLAIVQAAAANAGLQVLEVPDGTAPVAQDGNEQGTPGAPGADAPVGGQMNVNNPVQAGFGQQPGPAMVLPGDPRDPAWKDDVTKTTKTQECVRNSSWPKHDKDGKITMDIFIHQLVDAVINSSRVTSIFVRDDEAAKEAFETYLDLFGNEVTILEGIREFKKLQDGEFGHTYSTNEWIQVFDSAIHAQLMNSITTYQFASSIAIASENNCKEAGMKYGRRSGVILFLTIKKQIRGESTYKHDRAVRYIRDTDETSNRPTKSNQIMEFLNDVRNEHYLCATTIGESELVEEVQDSLQKLFPVSQGFDHLGTAVNQLVERNNKDWSALYNKVSECMNYMFAKNRKLMQHPNNQAALEEGKTYARAQRQKREGKGEKRQNQYQGDGKGGKKGNKPGKNGGKGQQDGGKKRKGGKGDRGKNQQTPNQQAPKGPDGERQKGSCAICWQMGHWKDQCPQNTANKKPNDTKGNRGGGGKAQRGKGNRQNEYQNEGDQPYDDSQQYDQQPAYYPPYPPQQQYQQPPPVQQQAYYPPQQQYQLPPTQQMQVQRPAPTAAFADWWRNQQPVVQPQKGTLYITDPRAAPLVGKGAGGFRQGTYRQQFMYRQMTNWEHCDDANSFAMLAGQVPEETGEACLPCMFPIPPANIEYPGDMVPAGTFEFKARKKKSRKVDSQGNRKPSKTLKAVETEKDKANAVIEKEEDSEESDSDGRLSRAYESIKARRAALRHQRTGGTPYLLIDGGANVSNFKEPQLSFTYAYPKYLTTMGGTVEVQDGGMVEVGCVRLEGTHNPQADNIVSLGDLTKGGYTYMEDGDSAWFVSPWDRAYKLLEQDRLQYLTLEDLKSMRVEALAHGFESCFPASEEEQLEAEAQQMFRI